MNFRHLSSPLTNSVKAQSLQMTGWEWVHSIEMLGVCKCNKCSLSESPVENPE